MVLGLTVTVAVARWLGPGDFGRFNYVMSVVLLGGVLANMGLMQVTTRRLVEAPGSHPTVLGTSVGLTLVGGFICYGLLALGSPLLGDGVVPALVLIMGLVLVFNPLRLMEAWFQSQVQSRTVMIATSFAAAASAFFKLAFILMGFGVVWFGLAFLLESVLLAAFLAGAYIKHTGRLGDLAFNGRMARELLRTSWPLLVSGFSMMVYLRIDQVMLGRLAGEAALGEYAAAVRLSTIWYVAPMLVARSLFPAIVRLRSEAAPLFHSRLQQYFDLNALMAYAIMLPVFLLAPWLVPFLFGEDYAGGAGILRIHVLGAIIVFLGVARTQLMISEGWTQALLVSNVSGAVINVAGNLLLIPAFGGIGAAWATVASFVASGLVCTLCFRRVWFAGILQLRALAILLRPRDLAGILSLAIGLRK